MMRLCSLNVALVLIGSLTTAGISRADDRCDARCLADLRGAVRDMQTKLASLQVPRLPIGTLMPYVGKSLPDGFVWADGSIVDASRKELNVLCAIIGDAFRLKTEPVGTCRLPDLRGRAPIGSGQAPGLSNRTIGEILGEEAHALTIAELAAHDHGGLTGTDNPDHTHNYGYPLAGSWGGGQGELRSLVPNIPGRETGGANQRHRHAISSQGGGVPHNNMQPSVVVGYIIRFAK